MINFVRTSLFLIAIVGAQSLYAQARVAVLHLAPFAADIDDTARRLAEMVAGYIGSVTPA